MEMRTKHKNNLLAGVKRWFVGYAGQLIFLGTLILILSIVKPIFTRPVNIINVSRQVSINMIVACAVTMVLISGGIDLSTGSVIAMSGMVASYMSLAGLPFWLCAITAIATGCASGLVNGFILANTSVPPFIVTYSMQSILRGMVYVITKAGTVRLTDQTFLDFGGGSLGRIPYPVIYMIIVIVLSIILLSHTKIGRHIFALGGNTKAAIFAGINIKRVKVLIYALSGTCAAISGLILTSRNTSMQPSVGTGTEMDAVAAVVLGGTSMAGGLGAIGGTVIGAFIIGIINNGLNLLGMDSFYQYICKGVVILAAVYIDDIKNKRLAHGAIKAKAK